MEQLLVYYLTNQTTTMLIPLFINGGKRFGKKHDPKNEHSYGLLEESGSWNLRKPKDIFISKTARISVHFLRKNNIIFNIGDIDSERFRGYGYEHNSNHCPRIIHTSTTDDPNIYIVFIVYDNEIVRLQLVIETSESSPPSVKITSIHSWEFNMYENFKETTKRLYSHHEKEKNVDDVVQFLEKKFLRL